MRAQKILFVTSEVYPLVKTGGLADVAAALPAAIKGQRRDVRIVLPAYRQALKSAERLNIASLALVDGPYPCRLLAGRLPDSGIKVWLVDAPAYFDRPGNPYLAPDGTDWPDNAERFATFAHTVVAVALNRAGLDWQPDIVHCNDWQSALVPALLSQQQQRPATVFTIHNLAYRGIFPAEVLPRLGLPSSMWSMYGLEFYGSVCFMKGGLYYADRLTTVSPTYAKEICTPAFGNGLDGLLRDRADQLTGILNGVDYQTWDPATDPHLPAHYSRQDLTGKPHNKAALQRRTGLPASESLPVLGMISRLVEQKGMDLALNILPTLLAEGAQVVVLGSGERRLEHALLALSGQYPGQLAVHIGFDETLAHLIEAGSDMFLMPSRFEPCGLNQIYSLRYGTVPIVRRTGGLADTVIDATDANLAAGSATGFVFDEPTSAALLTAVRRALRQFHQPAQWQQLMLTGMAQDFSWSRSAKAYLNLYRQALADARGVSAA